MFDLNWHNRNFTVINLEIPEKAPLSFSYVKTCFAMIAWDLDYTSRIERHTKWFVRIFAGHLIASEHASKQSA